MFPFLKCWTLIGVINLLFIEKQNAAPTTINSWQFDVTISSARPDGSITVGDTYQGFLKHEVSLLPTIQIPDLELHFLFADHSFDSSDDLGGSFTHLSPDLDPALSFCVDMEDRGFPTGAFFHIYPDNSFQYSLDGNSEYEGYVTFTPIPEPSSTLLLLAAITGLLFTRKR